MNEFIWQGGRSYSRSGEEDDEGHWNGSWHFTKKLPIHTTMTLHLRISRPTSAKLKDKRTYTLSVESFRGPTTTIASALCNSIADCKAHADKVLFISEIRDIYRRIYDRDSAVCWYLTDGTPFATFFDRHGFYEGLAPGSYLQVRGGITNRVFKYTYSQTGSGQTSSSHAKDAAGDFFCLPTDAPRPWAGFIRY